MPRQLRRISLDKTMKKQRSEAEIAHGKARFTLARLLPRSSNLLSPMNRKSHKQRQRIQAGFAAVSKPVTFDPLAAFGWKGGVA
jgi:hypothetical protein